MITYFPTESSSDFIESSDILVMQRTLKVTSQQKIISAWGNPRFQLIHSYSETKRTEDIMVFRVENDDLISPPVTQINLYDFTDPPTYKQLSFDIYTFEN